jgi:ferric reductase like protein
MGNLQLWLWIALFAGLVVAQHAKNSTEPVTKTNSTGGSATKSSAAGGPTANSNSSGSNASSDYYDSLDFRYAYFDMVALAALVFVLFLWNSSIGISGHLRRLVSLNNETQRYFTRGDSRIAWLKEHIIYAPLFRTRHNREFQLSRAVNMGILPSRFQSLVFTALVFLNVFYCVVNIPFSQPMKTTATLVRNRTGTIATINMIPLVILAGRNNPLIPLLRISFDTWNFFHRSLARIVVLESIAHVISWVVPKVQARKSSPSPFCGWYTY